MSLILDMVWVFNIFVFMIFFAVVFFIIVFFLGRFVFFFRRRQ